MKEKDPMPSIICYNDQQQQFQIVISPQKDHVHVLIEVCVISD